MSETVVSDDAKSVTEPIVQQSTADSPHTTKNLSGTPSKKPLYDPKWEVNENAKTVIEAYHKELQGYLEGPEEVSDNDNEIDGELSVASDFDLEERSSERKDEYDNVTNELSDLEGEGDKEKGEASEDASRPPTATRDQEEEQGDSERIEAGMLPEIKKQYEGNKKCNCCINWVDEKPAALRVRSTDHSAYALLVRIQLNHDESVSKKTSVHSIVIRSPLLRKKLKSVFEKLPNLSLDTSETVFKAPFFPFVYRWNAFTHLLGSETDGTTKEHLKLLNDVIQPELIATFAAIKDFEVHNAIAFQDLWAVYKPNSILVSTLDDMECAFKLRDNPRYGKTSHGTMTLVLECDYIDWDGEKFVPVTMFLDIEEYLGTKGIQDLTVFPLSNHPEEKAIEKRLFQRGERFVQLSKFQVLFYDGVAHDLTERRPQQYHIRGRVVVSPSDYFQANPQNRIKAGHRGSYDDGSVIESYDDDDYKIKTPEKFERDDHVICRPLVRGFSLTLKAWLDFNVSKLTDVEWNEKIFESLVLDTETKGLLFSMARSHAKSRPTFDDFVRGKGRGLIILLHGPSGVGKTLTAEAVAETMKVPLYTLKVGELGYNPATVQSRLNSAFKICKQWNAVLLLDEADVFMEERSNENLARNELVSIFLQEIEYQESILFLTTNRISVLDPAFQSRIHLSLAYDVLAEDAKRKVWTNLLGRIPQDSQNVSEADLDALAKAALNGREIKNVISTAVLLAEDLGKPLEKSHLDTVLRIRGVR